MLHSICNIFFQIVARPDQKSVTKPKTEDRTYMGAAPNFKLGVCSMILETVKFVAGTSRVVDLHISKNLLVINKQWENHRYSDRLG